MLPLQKVWSSTGRLSSFKKWKRWRKPPNHNNNHGDGQGKCKFKGKCNHCRKLGRKEANCWEKYPEKKPVKFQKSGDTSGANIKILVVNIARVPEETESYEELLGMNQNLPESLDEKGMEVSDDPRRTLKTYPSWNQLRWNQHRLQLKEYIIKSW